MTTPSTTVELTVRTLKVGRRFIQGKARPFIRISGKDLPATGSRLRVVVSGGSVILTPYTR